MLGIIPRSPTPVPLENRPLSELTTEQLHQVILRQRERLEQTERTPKKEEPDIEPQVPLDGAGGADKPILLNDDDDEDADDGSDMEVLEVVNLARKRKAEVLDISDNEAS